jgi:hypothetical protein
MGTDQDVWTILGGDESSWGIQVQKIDIEPGMSCECVETGAVFRVEEAARIDGTSAAAGRRVVRFYPVTGEVRLEKGFHMIPRPGTGRPPPDWLRPTAEDVLLEEIVKVPPNLRSKIMVASTEDIDIHRPGSWILFVYDGIKVKPDAGWKWLSSARVLFRILAETNVNIPVLAIAYHLLDPLFDLEHLRHLVPAVPTGKGDTIWFRDGAAYAALQSCTDENVEIVRRLTDELLRV